MLKVLLKNKLLPLIHKNSLFQDSQRLYAKHIAGKHISVPLLLVIETHNYCNSRCIMCGYPTMSRGKGFMEHNLFEKIIRDAASIGVEAISLHFYNEPFIDKDIFKKARLVKDLGLQLSTISNASLLTEDVCKDIVDCRFDSISLSIDAAKASTYERIRVGLRYDEVIKNVKNLIKIKNDRNSTLKINLNFVEMGLNTKEKSDFLDMWRGHVDRIDVNIGADFYNLEGSANNVLIAKRGNKNRVPCKMLWWMMAVLYDGRVALCCNDYDGKCIVGDLNKQSIKDIWTGNLLTNIRKSHLNGIRESIPLCKGCPIEPFWFNKIKVK